MTTKRHPEYLEGQEATEKFERGMRALFQVPKSQVYSSQTKKARKKRAKRLY